jgi:hypothetical protein
MCGPKSAPTFRHLTIGRAQIIAPTPLALSLRLSRIPQSTNPKPAFSITYATLGGFRRFGSAVAITAGARLKQQAMTRIAADNDDAQTRRGDEVE